MQTPVKRSILPLLMLLLGVGLIAGAVVVLIVISRPTEPPAQTLVQTTDSPEPQVLRVTLQGAKDAYEQRSAVFLDVRAAQFYAESHIRGAVSIPYDEIADRLGELNKNAWIITYCT